MATVWVREGLRSTYGRRDWAKNLVTDFPYMYPHLLPRHVKSVHAEGERDDGVRLTCDYCLSV